MIQDLIYFLEWIGLTKENITFSLIIILVLYTLIIKNLNNLTKKINILLKPIEKAIIEIQTVLIESGKTIKYLLTETRDSPIKPSEFGLELLKGSGLKKIIIDNKSKFLEELKDKLKKGPITAYDVQEKAIQLLLEYKTNKIIDSVKSYAFKEGIEIEIILRLGGLVLRDEYLKEHPEIK